MSNVGRGHFEGTPIAGLIAGTDMSSYQYYFVKMGGTSSSYDFKIAVCSGTSDRIIGVLADTPDAANRAALVYGPGSKVAVKAGGTIPCGAKVTTGTDGKAYQLTGTDQTLAGYSLNYAVSGDLVEFNFVGGEVSGTA